MCGMRRPYLKPLHGHGGLYCKSIISPHEHVIIYIKSAIMSSSSQTFAKRIFPLDTVTERCCLDVT